MAKIIDITASDYSNLSQEFSNKNIINKIVGTEYVVTEKLDQIVQDVNGQNPNEIEITNNQIVRPSADRSLAVPSFVWVHSRAEEAYTGGKFTIVTDEIIADINSISIDWNINYNVYENEIDKAKDTVINENNYNSLRTLEYSYLNNDAYKKGEQSTSTNIGRAKATRQIGGGLKEFSLPDSSFLQGETKVASVKKLEDGKIEIVVEYHFLTWSGENQITAVAGSVYSDLLYLDRLRKATSITMNVRANVVTTESLNFSYTNPNSAYQERVYELETSELLQANKTDPVEIRNSYLVSSWIFGAFGKDRAIVSFDLVNTKKYDFDGEERFLQAEDIVRIKDLSGKYIGEESSNDGELIPTTFKIIKIENVWDGYFHKKVICRAI